MTKEDSQPTSKTNKSKKRDSKTICLSLANPNNAGKTDLVIIPILQMKKMKV